MKGFKPPETNDAPDLTPMIERGLPSHCLLHGRCPKDVRTVYRVVRLGCRGKFDCQRATASQNDHKYRRDARRPKVLLGGAEIDLSQVSTVVKKIRNGRFSCESTRK